MGKRAGQAGEQPCDTPHCGGGSRCVPESFLCLFCLSVKAFLQKSPELSGFGNTKKTEMEERYSSHGFPPQRQVFYHRELLRRVHSQCSQRTMTVTFLKSIITDCHGLYPLTSLAPHSHLQTQTSPVTSSSCHQGKMSQRLGDSSQTNQSPRNRTRRLVSRQAD